MRGANSSSWRQPAPHLATLRYSVALCAALPPLPVPTGGHCRSSPARTHRCPVWQLIQPVVKERHNQIHQSACDLNAKPGTRVHGRAGRRQGAHIPPAGTRRHRQQRCPGSTRALAASRQTKRGQRGVDSRASGTSEDHNPAGGHEIRQKVFFRGGGQRQWQRLNISRPPGHKSAFLSNTCSLETCLFEFTAVCSLAAMVSPARSPKASSIGTATAPSGDFPPLRSISDDVLCTVCKCCFFRREAPCRAIWTLEESVAFDGNCKCDANSIQKNARA